MPRIYTRCPSCGNDTLTINDDKHLLCTWVTCKDPTLIDHPERLTADNTRLTAERDAAVKYSERLRGAINGSGPRDVDYAIALEKERDRLTAEVAQLKTQFLELLEEQKASEAEVVELRKDRELVNTLELGPVFIDLRARTGHASRLIYRSTHNEETLREAYAAMTKKGEQA